MANWETYIINEKHSIKTKIATYLYHHSSNFIRIEIRDILKHPHLPELQLFKHTCSIYIYTEEKYIPQYKDLLELSPLDKIRCWQYLNLKTIKDRIHLEKIFSTTDKYFKFSDQTKERIAKIFDLRVYAIDSCFDMEAHEAMKTYQKTKTILTFLLCVHRLKSKKLIIPKFIKFEIICFLFESRLSNNQFIEFYERANKELLQAPENPK